MEKQSNYSVKKLATLAGVSVRTLHLYDELKLLKPSVRTNAGYRLYGEKELLCLQQILFYKELDLPLKTIKEIIDDPDFDLIKALNSHKTALIGRKKRINTLLQTIKNTVDHLKIKKMPKYESLYEGMPKEQATAWRKDAIEKWGEDNIVKSENYLLNMPDGDLEQLKADQKDIRIKLRELKNEDVKSDAVQQQIGRHYVNIRGFWGLSPADGFKAARYKALADLYLADDRYMAENGKPDPEFAQFMLDAIYYFAEKELQ